MTNTKEFNSCSKLANEETINAMNMLYEKLKKDGVSPFDYLLKLQNSLQTELVTRYGRTYVPSELYKTGKKGELYDFIKDQQDCINDEMNELFHSISGTHLTPSEQSAIWKKWKSNYDNLRNEKINDNLDENSQLERSFEMIDIMHFVFNMLICLGVDSEQKLFTLYCLKHAENLKRYDENY